MLLEAPLNPVRRQMNSVLLTIDLTKAVADEAIARKDCVVVAYRLWCLSPLWRMTMSDMGVFLQIQSFFAVLSR